MADTPENEIPLGQKIRDRVNAALADTRRDKIQLELLDKAFEDISKLVPQLFNKEFQQLERHIKIAAPNNPEKEALIIITAVTTTAKNDDIDSPYSPIRTIRVPVSTSFTQFTAQQIRELPGYIKLHEAARELDVALNLGGLMDGDEGRSGVPSVTVNAMKNLRAGHGFHLSEPSGAQAEIRQGQVKGLRLISP